ncbi:MAG: undecaprenyldiphospho-muramoylpentapeptide beta-N-acetylglucosaminyltransferase [Candidatus Sericytochromatia bacterium]|nr:undecaprenyldiphospho-muramoylpentapeptide beta-N-acetylglucosaminyltransferase [Candidatus Sericytochromatia bacterium]
MSDIILTGGGTGGHVYPALAVAHSINVQSPGASILFVGTPDRLEARVVPEAGFRFFPISSRGFTGGPREVLRTLVSLFSAYRKARELLLRERPYVVLGTGGYVSAPVLLAARGLGIPFFLHEQNVVPGKVNRVLGHWARRVYTSLPGSEKYLPKGKVTLIGNPVRKSASCDSPRTAKGKLGFPLDAPLLLVTGGSQGARRINEAVAGLLGELLEKTNWSVCLICGPAQFESTHRLVHQYLGERLQLHAYFDQMPTALFACDLAIARAGATTLAELTTFGKPMVLVPYPYAGGHQKFNAAAVTAAGAGICLTDEDCSVENLAKVLVPLLSDSEKLIKMAANSMAFGRPNAAEELAREVLQCLKSVQEGR